MCGDFYSICVHPYYEKPLKENVKYQYMIKNKKNGEKIMSNMNIESVIKEP